MCMEKDKKRKPYTAEDVVYIYQKHGKKISLEKAEIILIFLRKLAKLTVEQYFNS